MNATERKVIRNVIRRLQCAENTAFGKPSYVEREDVRLGLTGSVDPAGILSGEAFTIAQRRIGVDNYLVNMRLGRSVHSYLDTWVIGALERLLDEEDGGTGRDLKLALDLSNLRRMK